MFKKGYSPRDDSWNSLDERAAAYNRMSRWYDLTAGRWEKKIRIAGLKRLRAQRGERILEIGFGTGHALRTLAQIVGWNGRVFGLDISDGMLRMARKRIKKADFTDHVLFTIGDARQLPYQANFFDGIFMSFSLELFSQAEIPDVLAECRRVLRECGRLGIVAMSGKGRSTLMMKLYKWAGEKFPRYVDCRPILAREEVERAGFLVKETVTISFFHLPVEIVVGRKQD
ncbi:MAG: methyltransferase domain-containing protein [Candidatus Aminicenantales bacterium]